MSGQKHQRVVAVDSMVLVWGIRKTGPEEKIRRARYLFSELEDDEAQVILPSVAVAEYITPLASPDERAQVVAAMGERFIISPFDANDAILAAQLYREGQARRKMGARGARVCLRADSLIVATAKNHGAREFYTEDVDCYNMASQVIHTKKLPTIGRSLFDD
ncbi:MAG: PIN domain-containing protein [Phycisphaerae bacterium]